MASTKSWKRIGENSALAGWRSFVQAQFLSHSPVKLFPSFSSFPNRVLKLLVILFWLGMAVLLATTFPLLAALYLGAVALATWTKIDIDKSGLR